MTFEIHVSPGMEQAQKCGRVKSVYGILTFKL